VSAFVILDPEIRVARQRTVSKTVRDNIPINMITYSLMWFLIYVCGNISYIRFSCILTFLDIQHCLVTFSNDFSVYYSPDI